MSQDSKGIYITVYSSLLINIFYLITFLKWPDKILWDWRDFTAGC